MTNLYQQWVRVLEADVHVPWWLAVVDLDAVSFKFERNKSGLFDLYEKEI